MQYLAPLVEKALDGSVSPPLSGRVVIEVGRGAVLSVQVAAPACRVLAEDGNADARITVTWARFLEVLEAETDPDRILAQASTSVSGSRSLASEVMRLLARVELRAVVQAKDDTAWQLRVNMEAMSIDEIRAFVRTRYGRELSPGADAQELISEVVDLFRRGARLVDDVRAKLPDPMRVSRLDVDPGALLEAYRRVKATLPSVENTCWGCGSSEGGPCGPSCRRLATGWSLQSDDGNYLRGMFGGPGARAESEWNVKTAACIGAFSDLVDSIPGCCRARIKVYRPGYQTGHAIHTDAGSIVRAIVPIVATEGPALSVEPYPGAYARDLLLHSYSVSESGCMYQFPTWYQHCGRNPERDKERAFILISQEVDDATAWDATA
jgi:hypothetical protein